jgi:hypothetical protein
MIVLDLDPLACCGEGKNLLLQIEAWSRRPMKNAIEPAGDVASCQPSVRLQIVEIWISQVGMIFEELHPSLQERAAPFVAPVNISLPRKAPSSRITCSGRTLTLFPSRL